MKLGILNNCTPKEEADFDEREFEAFRDFLNSVSHPFELTEYRVTEGELPASPLDCDAYLLTGSPKGVYDDERWIAELGEFVRESYAADRKLVGVCFGHQMLAHALGGHAEKSDKGWGMGRRPAEIVSRKPWMRPELALSNLYYCHQDQVISLPPKAELLGRNEFCPNMMFTIGDKVLATQAHPEFKDQTMQRAVDHFRKELPGDFLDEVAGTIEPGATDSQILAHWIVNFLTESSG